ncbi:MAG: hypothetical protein GXP35_10455, partial [Actinobacteria bacterium]|nr:hypothetical protein [Actinomycetota bacterium]
MPQLPKPSRTSVGVSMMVGVILVLIAGTIMVARRESISQVANRSGPAPVAAATQASVTTDTPIADAQDSADSTEPAHETTATTPLSSSIDASQQLATVAPSTTAGLTTTTLAPTSAAAVVQDSTSTSSETSQPTGALASNTTTSTDLGSQE